MTLQSPETGEQIVEVEIDLLDVPLGKPTPGSSRPPATSRERFGADAGWVIRWHDYAQLLRAAAGVLDTPAARREGLHEQVGSASNRIYPRIDTEIAGTGATLGARLVEEVLVPATRTLYEASLTSVPDTPAATRARETIHAWYWTLQCDPRGKAVRRMAEKTGTELKERVFRDRLWEWGFAEPHAFPSGYCEGLRELTMEIDRTLAPFLADTQRFAASADDLDVLLPRRLARHYHEREAELAQYRAKNLHEPSVRDGIDEKGRLQLLSKVLPRLAGSIERKENLLLLGPTSSGKSYVGRIAACHAVQRRGKAVILLPIKALVSQAVDEWKAMLEGTAQEAWTVLPGSRDYPQNDELLIRGDFQVAIMIPEKLNALISNGMMMSGCGLIIVDELQTLADEVRGPHLEMLLTRLRVENPSIPVIGLSATLNPASASTVSAWLGITPENVFQVDESHRPVPLEKVARGAERERVLLPDDQDHESTIAVPTQGKPSTHYRGFAAGARHDDVRRRTLELCLELLLSAPDGEGGLRADATGQRVLCFVPRRDDTETYAAQAREALERDPRFRRALAADDDPNPFRGRFGDLDVTAAAARWAAFERIPNIRARDQVEKGLRAGVGFHSARLEPMLRREVEWAFTEGLIRLLFTTDTLKLGLNLPADAVVVSSLVTPGSDARYVLDRDNAAQRLGRAGRLGISTRGRAYLLVPSRIPHSESVEFHPSDRHDLAALATPIGPNELPEAQAFRALCDVDAVFSHYLRFRAEGRAVVSQMTVEWYARVALEYLRKCARPPSRSTMELYVRSMFDASLGARSSDPATFRPVPGQILAYLADRRLLAVDADDIVRITALGRALGRAGLPLDDATTVESLTQNLEDGAGDLTLLWIAAQSCHVRDSTPWLKLPATSDAEREADLKRGVLACAARLAPGRFDAPGPDVDLPRSIAALVEKAEDVVGDGVVADQLVALVDGRIADPDLALVDGLLRGCVLLLWARGCPLEEIDAFLTATVRTVEVSQDTIRPRGVPVHYTDVQALGGNAGYLFEAGSELLGVQPPSTEFRRLENLGEAVDVGLPARLAPLARLNMRAAHRERLSFAVPLVIGRPDIELAEIVTRLALRPTHVRGDERTARVRNRTLETTERDEILAELERRDATARHRRARLSGRTTRMVLPGGRATFGDAFVQLNDPESPALVSHVHRFFENCGVDVATGTGEAGQLLVSSRVDPRVAVRVTVDTEPVTQARVASVRAGGGLVLAVGGITADVMTAMRPQPPHSAVVVEVSVFVEFVASVLDALGVRDELDALVDDEMEAILMGSLDQPPSAPVAPAEPGAAARGTGYELLGHRLLLLLTSAPPVLRQSDAVRLRDGLSIAPVADMQEDS